MEDIITFCEGSCGKHCHLREPAGKWDEVTSCSSGSKNRRYRKCGNGDENDAEPRAPDRQCSVEL